MLYALDSLCKCQERDLLGIECGLVDVAVQVTAEWRPGKYSSIFSDSKASTYPVLELSTDILMHLAHSEACRKRMHDLYLESILDRLLLTAEGVVREHVCKVLWVLRDQLELAYAAKQIVIHVGKLREVSDRYSWTDQTSSSKHRELALRLTAGLRHHQLDQEMYASWNWMRETFLFDKMQRSGCQGSQCGVLVDACECSAGSWSRWLRNLGRPAVRMPNCLCSKHRTSCFVRAFTFALTPLQPSAN